MKSIKWSPDGKKLAVFLNNYISKVINVYTLESLDAMLPDPIVHEIKADDRLLSMSWMDNSRLAILTWIAPRIIWDVETNIQTNPPTLDVGDKRVIYNAKRQPLIFTASHQPASIPSEYPHFQTKHQYTEAFVWDDVNHWFIISSRQQKGYDARNRGAIEFFDDTSGEKIKEWRHHIKINHFRLPPNRQILIAFGTRYTDDRDVSAVDIYRYSDGELIDTVRKMWGDASKFDGAVWHHSKPLYAFSTGNQIMLKGLKENIISQQEMDGKIKGLAWHPDGEHLTMLIQVAKEPTPRITTIRVDTD